MLDRRPQDPQRNPPAPIARTRRSEYRAQCAPGFRFEGPFLRASTPKVLQRVPLLQRPAVWWTVYGLVWVASIIVSWTFFTGHPIWEWAVFAGRQP